MTKLSIDEESESGYPHVYLVDSESEEGVEHTVKVRSSAGAATCDCKGFEIRQKCSHITAALEAEAEAAAEREASERQIANLRDIL